MPPIRRLFYFPNEYSMPFEFILWARCGFLYEVLIFYLNLTSANNFAMLDWNLDYGFGNDLSILFHSSASSCDQRRQRVAS